MTFTYIPNPLLKVQILVDPAFNLAMDGVAALALESAQAHVPVDTGELKGSLHIEDAPDGGRRIVAGTDHWIFPEFGTQFMGPEPYLRPILSDLGLHP